jgi:hypothetical protein
MSFHANIRDRSFKINDTEHQMLKRRPELVPEISVKFNQLMRVISREYSVSYNCHEVFVLRAQISSIIREVSIWYGGRFKS